MTRAVFYGLSYNVSGREITDGVLGCQRDGAQHDEDEDEVGEDLMIDEPMACHTDPVLQTEVKRTIVCENGQYGSF